MPEPVFSMETDLPDPKTLPGQRIGITIETIVISALIFAGILAWLQFIELIYNNVFPIPPMKRDLPAVWNRLCFCFLITVIILALVYLTYRLSPK